MATLDLTTTGVAAGGDTIARDEGGRVVFVAGALPGERVRADVVEEKHDFARARVVEVLDASPDRVAPPCPEVERGCGGCGWQHVEPAAQRRLKAQIVADALRRTAGIAEPVVDEGPDLPPDGYRTTVRATVRDGRAGFRRHHSHDVLEVESCLVAHPLLAELLEEGTFGDATEVVLRAGARTGDRLVVATPTAAGVVLPDDVTVVGNDELNAGHRAWIHEEVAGRRWRISARSFFQARPDGADALVDAVAAAAAGAGGPMVDLYAGVGLFAGTVGLGPERPEPPVAVEWSSSSVADAKVNLAGAGARIRRVDVSRWKPERAGLVVADPARTGLDRAGAHAVAATHAIRLVLVSCDPAALARDTKILAEAGFQLTGTTLVDLFPHTAHVEAVSRFERTEENSHRLPSRQARGAEHRNSGRRHHRRK